MKKIVTVLGARPQFIKASVVSHAMRQSGQLQEVLVHTGQHFDANMSDVFFEELGMHKPDHFLAIHGGGHGAMTGRMLEQVEKVLLVEKPDAVMVYGDTNSTLAGALAAAKLHIPVAHVEAGLRSFNMAMPEEVNRILTDRISRWLFTPTAAASAHKHHHHHHHGPLPPPPPTPQPACATAAATSATTMHHCHRRRPICTNRIARAHTNQDTL